MLLVSSSFIYSQARWLGWYAHGVHRGSSGSRAPSRLRIFEFTQYFWVFSFYIADFWQTFWVIWENGSNWSNLRLKMSFFALGRLKNHKVPHLHPNSTMFMPLDRLQLKIYAFSGKFNVCSKRVVLSWIKICCDFTLQAQIFNQKYRSLLRFYSEFLRKNFVAEVSDSLSVLSSDLTILSGSVVDTRACRSAPHLNVPWACYSSDSETCYDGWWEISL